MNNPTDAVIASYATRKAMAEAICEADKGEGFDIQPPGVRGRYMHLAEVALNHAASHIQIVVMHPTHVGWRSSDNSVAVAGCFDCAPPEGYETLYREEIK